MISPLLICILTLFAYGESTDDPNGYFKKRVWALKINGKSKLHITSDYRGEPVQSPNKLKAVLHCPKGKKVIVLENYKYCGLDSVQVLSERQFEVRLADFNPNDPKGYCNYNKRVEKFEIPPCP